MKEDKSRLWKLQIVLCVLLLAGGLTLRYAVGGTPYQICKSWYVQQMNRSVLPSLSMENLQKTCRDFLSSYKLPSVSQQSRASSQSAASSASSKTAKPPQSTASSAVSSK